ncbi:uncharacterized protein LOC116255941 [Nymphaea colorata]|nr:uncharacterized protein LOC116255941 [Nymphaea colorata]
MLPSLETSFFLPCKDLRGDKRKGRHRCHGVVTGFLLPPSGLDGSYYTSKGTLATLRQINARGPFISIIVPNAFEMNPLLNSSSFKANTLRYLDISGRRFRFGTVEGKKVIIVMTGLSTVNAGITTQLLLTLFKVKGVVHYGIAGNANSALEIGDVTIPQYWAHTGLWNWQVEAGRRRKRDSER